MLTLNCRNLNVTKINFKFINDNYKNTLGQLLLYTVKQIDVICQHLQQRPLCLAKQNNNSTKISLMNFVFNTSSAREDKLKNFLRFLLKDFI